MVSTSGGESATMVAEASDGVPGAVEDSPHPLMSVMSMAAPDIAANEYLLIDIFIWLVEWFYEKTRCATEKADTRARGRHSDRTGERWLHSAAACAVIGATVAQQHLLIRMFTFGASTATRIRARRRELPM